ncbi:response regulator transcription factor [Robiginitalea biformata]|uniref:Response regulator containing a CheY-like receiver domain and an HTH DNA-binding domain n=1 Tax=Robiginitalea biformata (strain ATCC BAA-864 / DSM 15991 / KCTC 12146 / HTCC2501) TaxID=313596 RepID=A4CN07_ROBBH|nr:response regulator transcription factor [Robiginitalea biformata]EAR15049.1 Response regulator containing a CheY-like receiver domain and an HTH DNA-binding domain [Robiginitalea biformata HTCC2501]
MIRIALVDDHRLFLEGIRSILDREIGLEVHASVGQGVELLNLLKTTRADVVLTDIRMPGMDGLSLTRQICRSFPNTRVIALTMLDHEQDVKDLLDAGARGYLVKNVEKEELVQAIHTVARGDYYLSRKFRPIYKNWKSQEPRQESVRLTRRERQVLELIAQGRTSQQIAESLKLSRFTIDTHRKNIHKKMGIRSNIGLLKAASKWLGQAPQDTDNRQ